MIKRVLIADDSGVGRKFLRHAAASSSPAWAGVNSSRPATASRRSN